MRASLVLLHRWFGLFIAVFLFVSGLTGAVISWDHEIDEWLNPQLFEARSEGPVQTPQALAAQLEARDPRLQVGFMPLYTEPGHSFGVSVNPRIDPATGKAYELDFNQIALDPVTGEEQGRRMWGEVSLSRENLMPFLYTTACISPRVSVLSLAFCCSASSPLSGRWIALSPSGCHFRLGVVGVNPSPFAGSRAATN